MEFVLHRPNDIVVGLQVVERRRFGCSCLPGNRSSRGVLPPGRPSTTVIRNFRDPTLLGLMTWYERLLSPFRAFAFLRRTIFMGPRRGQRAAAIWSFRSGLRTRVKWPRTGLRPDGPR